MGMARAVLVGALLVLILGASAPLAWVPAPAEAGGVKIIIGGGPRLHSGVHHPHRFHHRRTPHGHQVHPHDHHFIAPRTIVVVPAPPPRRWVPGHWTYQWIPQSLTHEVWVPGRWSLEGTWIPGRYEPRAISAGYYRPLWVEGYWVPY